jgi:5'-nucleotidase / UDP-sugar diphosphatase
MLSRNIDRWKTFFFPHGLIYTILTVLIIVLTILTVVYASLWQNGKSPMNIVIPTTNYNRIIGYPILQSENKESIQWTFLHLNDVYELLPLDRGRKGGLARVAFIRKLLQQENSHTYTILAGDLLSPSALGLSKVNGSTLNGRQMISTMNTLGLDFMTFGNHEFDLNETELRHRMNESNFKWISSNVFSRNTRQLFGSSISHQFINIEAVRILLIGLTIDGTGAYVDIINQSSLVNYVRQFLNSFPNSSYDVLVAITHLDMRTDIELASKITQIDLILGGHEHENSYFLRGTKLTPIYKADANAVTVFIHRCTFDVIRKQFNVYSTLVPVNSQFNDEKNTATTANHWFNLGIQGFQASGYEPNDIVSCLPAGFELDGRSESVRNFRTDLTESICESLLYMTNTSETVIGIINGGTVRIDDILRETITQYDILRTLPFANNIVALSVPGQLLAQVLTTGVSLKGNGMFLTYTRLETSDNGHTWLFNGTDISKSGLNYRVATTGYIRMNTLLRSATVNILLDSTMIQTRGLIEYLKVKYPAC